MALILAVDPEASQKQALHTLARLLDDHELATASSCAEALSAIDARTPDLLLVPLLLPESDESALLARLRERSKRRNVRVLTTPLLKAGDPSLSPSSRFGGWLKASDDVDAGERCEPGAFAQMIREYLVASSDEARVDDERRRRRDAAVMAAAGAAASWIRARRSTWTDAPLPKVRVSSPVPPPQLAIANAEAPVVEPPASSGFVDLASSIAIPAREETPLPAGRVEFGTAPPRPVDEDDLWTADPPAADLTSIDASSDDLGDEEEEERTSPLKKIARWAKPLGARVRRKSPRTIAGVLLAIGGTVGCAYWLKPRTVTATAKMDVGPSTVLAGGMGAPPADAPVRKAGQLAIDSTPPGAQVLIDGKSRGVTPLTIDNVAPGTHVVMLQSEAGSVRRSIAIKADRPTAINENIFPGWVTVMSPFEVSVVADGQAVRLDEHYQVMLPPGPHEVKVQSRSTGYDETRHVEVLPGENIRITVSAPRSKLSVNASAPADVLVDGASIGSTPLANAPIDVGTRDIVVRSAAGERRFTVPVTTKPLSLDVDFSKP